MVGDRYVDGRTLHGRVAWKMEFRSRGQIERNDRKLDWIQGKTETEGDRTAHLSWIEYDNMTHIPRCFSSVLSMCS